MEIPILFYILLFIVAFLYSSVGHGGASGYLALMALFSVAPEVMKPTALLLNIFVSLIAFIQYYRSGAFHWKLFYPFAVTSVPFSFLGGTISISGDVYKQILGILLLIPVIRFIGFVNQDVEHKRPVKLLIALSICVRSVCKRRSVSCILRHGNRSLLKGLKHSTGICGILF